jgi:Sec-independent protein translocase protein TatA
LGPSDLYKLVKSIGSLVQNARTLGTDLTRTFETNMESQLQLEEIRKAQRELNDAFSFRRSINVDQDEDAFTTTVTSPREGQDSAGGSDGAAPPPSSTAEPAAASATGAPK